MIIKSSLTDGDDLGVAESLLGLGGDVGVPRRSLVGMHPRRGGELEAFGQVDGLQGGGLGVRHDHDVLDPRRPASLNDLSPVCVELVGAEMAVGVD
jgi:hypothetical protein